jgi:hypothetical protein
MSSARPRSQRQGLRQYYARPGKVQQGRCLSRRGWHSLGPHSPGEAHTRGRERRRWFRSRDWHQGQYHECRGSRRKGIVCSTQACSLQRQCMCLLRRPHLSPQQAHAGRAPPGRPYEVGCRAVQRLTWPPRTSSPGRVASLPPPASWHGRASSSPAPLPASWPGYASSALAQTAARRCRPGAASPAGKGLWGASFGDWQVPGGGRVARWCRAARVGHGGNALAGGSGLGSVPQVLRVQQSSRPRPVAPPSGQAVSYCSPPCPAVLVAPASFDL